MKEIIRKTKVRQAEPIPVYCNSCGHLAQRCNSCQNYFKAEDEVFCVECKGFDDYQHFHEKCAVKLFGKEEIDYVVDLVAST